MKLLHVLTLGVALLLPACLVAKTVAKGAVDVTLAECISRHADIEDEKELRGFCQWADELAPVVKGLLSARKEGVAAASAKAGARACPK